MAETTTRPSISLWRIRQLATPRPPCPRPAHPKPSPPPRARGLEQNNATPKLADYRPGIYQKRPDEWIATRDRCGETHVLSKREERGDLRDPATSQGFGQVGKTLPHLGPP